MVVVLATTSLYNGLTEISLAQNMTASQSQTADPTQIKSYLTEAIQALDNGNNTQVLMQIDLANYQLEMLTGTESANDDDEDGNEVEIKERTGEDIDEPGDLDRNDEDTP